MFFYKERSIKSWGRKNTGIAEACYGEAFSGYQEEKQEDGVMTRIEDTEKMVESIERHTEKIGHYMVDMFQFVALFVIGATIVWSGVSTYAGLITKGAAEIDDILLLFIYLELGCDGGDLL